MSAYISTQTTRNCTLSSHQKKAVQDSGGAEELHRCNQRPTGCYIMAWRSTFKIRSDRVRYSASITQIKHSGFQCRRKCHCRLRSNYKPRSSTWQASFIRHPTEHARPYSIIPTHHEFSSRHPGPYRGKFDRIPPGLLELSTCRDGTDKRHQTTTCHEQHRAHRHWNKPLRPQSTSAQGTALATCWLQDKV